MTESRDTTPAYKPGVDIPKEHAVEVWDFVVEKGKERFKDTAFVTGEDFTQHDLDVLKEYYQDVLDYQEERFGKDAVFNRSLLEHLSIGERSAQIAAPLVGIQGPLLEAVMLTHDFGRIFSHRRGRNNAIEEALAKKLVFSESFTKLLPPDTLWVEVDNDSLKKRLVTLTTENNGIAGVVELLDVLAKWKDKDSGGLRKWEDVIESSKTGQKKPDTKSMWPSELKRQTKITSDDGDKAIETKYEYLKVWFEKKSGTGVNEFVKRVENSLREKPLKNNWV